MKIFTGSLRRRFLASIVVWILVFSVAAGLLISTVFRWNVELGYHDEMEVHIEELAALTALNADGQPYLLRRLSDPRFLPLRSGFYWQVERAGFPTLTSPSLGSARLPSQLASGTGLRFAWLDGPTGETLEYGRAEAVKGGPPLRFLMASDKRLVDETMAGFDRSLEIALACLALLFLAGGLVQFKFVLRPLDRLAGDIGDVRAGRTLSMPDDYADEIKPVISQLNGLLAAQAELVARSRLIAGNLAHGLRTPLAIILDEAEQLDAAGHRASAQTMLREVDHMTRQVDYHLARARSAGAAQTVGKRASLSATLEPVLAAMRRLHRQRAIAFQIVEAADLRIACDPLDLMEILSNLLDNAGKWAASQCVVSWTSTAATACIMIDDDGRGLDPKYRERAFTVGERLDDVQPGSGLGLAIARDLARNYGGDVTLDESPQGGLRARVTLGLAD